MNNFTNPQGSGNNNTYALRRPFNLFGAGGDAKTSKFIEVAKTLISESKADLVGGNYNIFSVTDNSLLYPIIVLTDRRSIKGEEIIFFTTLILGNACRRAEPTEDVQWRDHRGTSVLQVTPDFIYHQKDSDIYVSEAVIKEVMIQTGIADVKRLRDCGSIIVKKIPGQEESYQDPAFVGRWLNIMANPSYSTYLKIMDTAGLLENAQDYYFNVNLLKGSPSVTISYNGAQLIGASGEPIRRDLTIGLSNVIAAGGTSAFVSNVSKEIIKVSGYIDTLWNGNSNSFNRANRYLPNARNGHADVFEQPYTPLAVITHFDNRADENVPLTLEVILAGLIAFSLVQDPTVWQRTYDPTYIGSETPYNIGATVIESGINIPEGEDIDFHDYIDACWKPNPVIAIDVERNSDTYWALQAFSGGNDAQVIEACDKFLQGNFKKYWNGTAPIIVKQFTLQGGYYATGKELRDIREIDDYIYLLNVIGNDEINKPNDRQDFKAVIDALNAGWNGYNDSQRLVTRYDILNSVANNSFQPTTLISRDVVHPAFINALVSAAIDAGIVINTNNRQIEDGRNVRYGLGISNYEYVPTNNIFVRGQPNPYRR